MAKNKNQRLWKKQYKRRGHCLNCGQCCRMDLVDPEAWERVKSNYSGDIPISPYCANLRWNEDKTTYCSIYKQRRRGCKDFPAHPNHLNRIRGCGYTFEERTPRR